MPHIMSLNCLKQLNDMENLRAESLDGNWDFHDVDGVAGTLQDSHEVRWDCEGATECIGIVKVKCHFILRGVGPRPSGC